MRRVALTPRELVEKLVSTYPDSIEDVDGDLNFEATCENLADCILRDFDPGRQKYYFLREFTGRTDCIRYLRNELQDLVELCQEFIDER